MVSFDGLLRAFALSELLPNGLGRAGLLADVATPPVVKAPDGLAAAECSNSSGVCSLGAPDGSPHAFLSRSSSSRSW